MSIIKLKEISVSYNTRLILNKINLDIQSGEKIGIIGKNGSGKTTLIKTIMKEIKPESGNIEIGQHTNIGYLKQATDYSVEDFITMTSEKEHISEFLKINSELNIDKDIDYTVDRLNSLSGGEKTKIALSEILSSNPSVLILDEPTNHVDIDSIEWLIEKIKKFYGSVIIVSHDRYFLNRTVNKIVEIDQGKINEYFGNYDFYEIEKEKEKKLLWEKYEIQQKEERKIENEISQLKSWSEKGEKEAGRQGGMRSDSKIKGVKTNAQRKAAKLSKSAENKKSRLEQMREDFIDAPQKEKEIKFMFQGESSGANLLIKTENLAKQFNSKVLFENANLFINKNDRIGLIGPNGSGKSTLIKILMNEILPSGGIVWKTPSLKVCYMTQDVFDLEEDKTVFEMAANLNATLKQFFFSNLANMGLKREIFNQKIKTLSLGERMRIKLVQIIIGDYNLLVLDEPTNHLDLPNKIQMEKALLKFPGAILLASHDKTLLSNITNKLFIFKENSIFQSEDSYSEYMEKNFDNIKKNNFDISIEDELRTIEQQMSVPGVSDIEINKLLERYYELIDIQEKRKTHIYNKKKFNI